MSFLVKLRIGYGHLCQCYIHNDDPNFNANLCKFERVCASLDKSVCIRSKRLLAVTSVTITKRTR